MTKQRGAPLVAAFAAAGMMYNQAATVASGVLIGRVVGAADYGIANIAKNIFQIAAIVTPLGLDLALQRYLANGLDRERRATVTILRMVAFGAALIPMIVLALGLGRWLEENVYIYPRFSLVMLCTFAALPFGTDAAVTAGAYRGLRRPGPPVLATYVLQPTFRVILVVLLFLMGWRLWAVVASTTAAAVLSWFYVYAIARRDLRTDFSDARTAIVPAGQVLRYSWVMCASLVITMMTKSVDVLVLGHYRPPAEVGRYVAVQLLVNLLTIFSAALGQTLGAAVTEKFDAGDRAGVVSLLRENIRAIGLLVAPLFAVIIFWGDRIDLILGATFRVEWGVVALLAVNQSIFALFAFTGYGLSMTRRQGLEAQILLGGLVSVVLLCILLVPLYGAVGAALATSIGVGGVSVTRFVAVRRILGPGLISVHVLLPFLWALLISGVLRFAVSGIDPRTFLSTAIVATLAIAGYAALAWQFLLSGKERNLLHETVRRRF